MADVMYLFKFTELFVLTQLLEVRDGLGVVETVVVVHLAVTRQLRQLQRQIKGVVRDNLKVV